MLLIECVLIFLTRPQEKPLSPVDTQSQNPVTPALNREDHSQEPLPRSVLSENA